jgi:uncharacterized DUF497 family protein
MADEFSQLFAKVRAFGWDNKKRDWTLSERGIDFDEVRFVFDGPTIAYRSDRKGEARYVVFGFLDNREVAIVCTLRDDVCWIISARRARKDERKKYHDRLPRRSAPKGQN